MATFASCANSVDSKSGTGWPASFDDAGWNVPPSDDSDADASPLGDDGGGQDETPEGSEAGSDDAAQEASDGSAAGDGGIAFHGESEGLLAGTPTVCSLAKPSQSAPDDLLIAALLFGNVSATGGVSVSPPAGWTELGQPAAITPDKAAVFVYWAVNGPSLAWPAQWQIGGNGNAGVAWLLSYGGVDTSTPPAFSAGASQSTGGTSWSTPMLPAASGDVVVATLGAFGSNPDGGPAIPTWSLPAPWTPLATLSDGQRRSGIVGHLAESLSTTSAQVTAEASGPNLPQYVTAAMLVLAPK